MTELLSCPFCGGDVSSHKDEECPGCHLIQCGQCRAFFDFATGADPGNDCASVDALRAAIAPMWNTRAQLAAMQGEVQRLREALKHLLSYAERQICEHEETHRGGAIWEICDMCGVKWADDEGGKPEFKWPDEIKAAHAALLASAEGGE